jgi:hypothetical protein
VVYNIVESKPKYDVDTSGKYIFAPAMKSIHVAEITNPQRATGTCPWYEIIWRTNLELDIFYGIFGSSQ